MKDSLYFPHDQNSRNDDKILKIRSKFNNQSGYGLFWMLVELMQESTNGYIDGSAIAELSLSLSIANSTLSEFIKFAIEIGLFVEEDGLITSKRVLEYKAFRRERSQSGLKGANTRWLSHSSANAKESKGKESKLNTVSKDIPSSIEEVKEFLQNDPLATEFWDFYSSKGWRVGTAPMKDWKAAARRARKWGNNGSFNTTRKEYHAPRGQGTPSV